MLKKIILYAFTCFLLSACASSQHSSSVAPPIVATQEYTEPEQQVSNPGSLFSLAEANDFYADNRARHAGDIVLIKIVENSKSKSKADTTAGRNSGMNIGVDSAFGRGSVGPFWGVNNGLSGSTGAQPILQASYDSNLNAKGETKRENFVTATIAARVQQVLPNGILQIQGAREIRVNDETQYMVVTGLARAQDIEADNSIESTHLADSRVEYFGKGTLADKQRSGWLTRLLDNIWPF